MKRTLATACAIVLPALVAFPAAAPAEPTPLPPAAVASEGALASGPLGTTIQVYSGGDMAVTVRGTDATVPPRTDGRRTLVYELTAEQRAGTPYLLPTLDLRLVTADGDVIYPLTEVPGECPSGFVEPGRPHTGLLAFGIPDDQRPQEIVFATADDVVHGAWTL